MESTRGVPAGPVISGGLSVLPVDDRTPRFGGSNQAYANAYSKPCDLRGLSAARPRHTAFAQATLTSGPAGKELTPLKTPPPGALRVPRLWPEALRRRPLPGTHRQQQRQSQPLTPVGSRLRGTGRWVDPKGYVCVRGPDPEHPNAKSSPELDRRACPGHVSSCWAGRSARGSRCITVNLLKDDNRPENLELWHTATSRGAHRWRTLLTWCRWFLEQYSDAPGEPSSLAAPSSRTVNGPAGGDAGRHRLWLVASPAR